MLAEFNHQRITTSMSEQEYQRAAQLMKHTALALIRTKNTRHGVQ
jgi:hypothetical protein